MQNSITYLERQCVVSQKLFGYVYKHNLKKKHGVLNLISRNISFNNQSNRLCFPLLRVSISIIKYYGDCMEF